MEKIKQSRIISYIIIALAYILATVVSITIYNKLELDWWLALLIADVIGTIIIFIFSLIFKNASVYDPYWSVQPPVILIAFATIEKMSAYAFLLIIVVSFWAIRLTLNWAYTFDNLNHQDWRYTMLKEKTKAFYPIINFVGIHLVPTLVVYGCILPGVYAIRQSYEINLLSVLFLCVSLFAVVLQGTADMQMHKYRKTRKTTFIRDGLWKYSRHPNYLGEILMWWGIGLSVFFATSYEWFLLIGAIFNTSLFLFVSIPMADKRQSRKNGFAEYKIQTRMLLPIKK